MQHVTCDNTRALTAYFDPTMNKLVYKAGKRTPVTYLGSIPECLTCLSGYWSLSASPGSGTPRPPGRYRGRGWRRRPAGPSSASWRLGFWIGTGSGSATLRDTPGGNLMFQGTHDNIGNHRGSLTNPAWVSGRLIDYFNHNGDIRVRIVFQQYLFCLDLYTLSQKTIYMESLDLILI